MADNETPFTDANQIDLRSLDELVEWYIDAGVSGLFAVCLSSEIFHLSEEERVKLSSHILKRVDGRIKVISGIIPSNNYADKIKHLYEIGLEAVIFLANQIFPENQDYDKSLENSTIFYLKQTIFLLVYMKVHYRIIKYSRRRNSEIWHLPAVFIS